MARAIALRKFDLSTRFVAGGMRTALLLLLCMLATPALSANAELSAMAAQDQAVRRGEPDPSSDQARRHRVLALLAAGEVATPRDKFNAALVLQHTELEFRDGRLASTNPENYLLAHHLFLAAMEGGIEEARPLVAASIDRYLGFTVGVQRYGTNRVIDQDTGEERLLPIDRSVSDEERATYGVPPLAELLAKWREQPRDGK